MNGYNITVDLDGDIITPFELNTYSGRQQIKKGCDYNHANAFTSCEVLDIENTTRKAPLKIVNSLLNFDPLREFKVLKHHKTDKFTFVIDEYYCGEARNVYTINKITLL